MSGETNCCMFSVIEEVDEVSSAITRHRYQDECVDVAHSALLLYLAIEKVQI